MSKKPKKANKPNRPQRMRRTPLPKRTRSKPEYTYSVTFTEMRQDDGTLTSLGLAVPGGGKGDPTAFVDGKPVALSDLSEPQLLHLLTPEDDCPICLAQVAKLRRVLARYGIFPPPTSARNSSVVHHGIRLA